MLNLSVKEFKDFIKHRIEQTKKCERLSDEEKNVKISVLEEILTMEFLEDIYDQHNTVWILSQAKHVRREIMEFIEGKEAQSKREEYTKLEKRREYLNESLNAYETMISDLAEESEEERHDFRESDFE